MAIRLASVGPVLALLLAGCTGSGPTESPPALVSTPSGAPPTAASVDPSPIEVPPVEMNETSYRVYNASGRIVAGALYTDVSGLSQYASIRAEVPVNATALVAEIRWTGATNDFRLEVRGPKYCPTQPIGVGTVMEVVCILNQWATGETPGVYAAERPTGTLGPGKLRVEVGRETLQADRCGASADACDWFVVGHWNTAVDAPYDLRLTVFYAGTPWPGYTAFEAP